MDTVRRKHVTGPLAFMSMLVLCVAGYSLLCPAVASAKFRDTVLPVYYVYAKGTSVIANKHKGSASPADWQMDNFIPQIITNGSACNSGNTPKPHDFNSSLKFNNCNGLAITAQTTPAANKAWFQDVNMSYVIGDFDNKETIDIGRGYIIAAGRSSVGNPVGQQKAMAQKDASDKKGSNKYDCDNPNQNTSDNCSLLIAFTNGDPGTFHITLDNDNYKPSIHEYWYDGPVTWDYHTLTFHPNGDGASVIENNADSQVIIRHTDVNNNVLREYDARNTAINFPAPTRAGYEFLGWSTSQNGNCKAAHNCVISKLMSKDVDLYAHWTAIVGGYVLAPHVNTPVDAVKQGESVTFTPSVTKDNSTDSNSTKWKFCRVLVAPGAAAPAAGSACSNPSATVVESKDNEVFRGSGPFTIGDPANYMYTVPAGTLYGSQICYALVVDSSTQDPPSHPAESVKCVIVAKSPRLQVWGNDTRVGSSLNEWVDNRMSLINASDGSWGEYGVIAPGTINGLGSGSVAGGTLLTFANKPTLGGFTQATSVGGLGTAPDVEAYLEKAGNAEYRAKTGINLVDAPATVGAYAANTVYTTASGTVTINGDIINPSKGNNLSQMVIIANNINIMPNVKQVDAWLVATNTINTCWLAAPDVPKIGNCGDNTNGTTLHINGPIMAKSLLLNRTGGLDTDDNSASEVVNLRGDAYIWMHKLSGETGSIRTVYTRELAPRY